MGDENKSKVNTGIPPSGNPNMLRNQSAAPQQNFRNTSSGAPYPSGKNVQFLEPEIIEKKNWELKHAGFAIIFAFILALVQLGAMFFLELETSSLWILAFILIVIFGVVVYFLMEPTKEKEIRQRIIETNLQTIDRPVIKEVLRTVEVEKPVIREIPIIKEVPAYREPRTVYAAKYTPKIVTKRSPSIKYAFVGSKLAKTYHKSSCRLGKSIGKKYKIKSPTPALFKKLRYKPCKTCIKKIKKR